MDGAGRRLAEHAGRSRVALGERNFEILNYPDRRSPRRWSKASCFSWTLAGNAGPPPRPPHHSSKLLRDIGERKIGRICLPACTKLPALALGLNHGSAGKARGGRRNLSRVAFSAGRRYCWI
jgi:hypothetical protein